MVPWLLVRLVPAFVAWNLLSGTSSSGRWRCGDPGLALLIAATLLYTVQSLAAFLLQSVSSPRGQLHDSISFQLFCSLQSLE